MPVVDSEHAATQAEVDAIRKAVKVLNGSDAVAASEENANHHSAAASREELLSIHVFELDGVWRPTKWGEEAKCKVCGSEVERERS